MKVREVIKLIEEDGWYLARTRGKLVERAIALRAHFAIAISHLTSFSELEA